MTEKTYPPLPKNVAHTHSDGDFCWDTQPHPNLVFWPVDLYTADQMRAYYDLGRNTQAQAAPQPAVPQGDALDAARYRWLRRKFCLTGNGDGTCAMQAINLPAAIPGWPEPGEVGTFCDAAIDAARFEQQL